MDQLPNGFYRISVKALILDEAKRFLLFKESDGTWELPGGGLDFGEDPTDCLIRELREESGLEAVKIKQTPCYFVIGKTRKGHWKWNIIYEVSVNNLEFKPSDECVEIRFFTVDEVSKEKHFQGVQEFIKQYNPTNH